jgi:hypothetical protein
VQTQRVSCDFMKAVNQSTGRAICHRKDIATFLLAGNRCVWLTSALRAQA